MTLARIIFGVVYMKDCPQQPNIPSYLLGLALMTLIMASWVILPCESSGAQPQSPPGCLKASLQVLVALCFFTWILAGDVWVFSVYQPNYDPTAADGLYCNKTLYTFAFWNAVWETLTVGTLLAKCCKGLLCCVLLQRTPPPPPNGDFNRNV
ncbi:transmembrane protein 272-like [Centroberyx gerrardi]|uniref:transmembrane protein 272-like n=1 Tax=Centroberyx gerrardi TaxID=166262 RepID=UPI003AABCC87